MDRLIAAGAAPVLGRHLVRRGRCLRFSNTRRSAVTAGISGDIAGDGRGDLVPPTATTGGWRVRSVRDGLDLPLLKIPSRLKTTDRGSGIVIRGPGGEGIIPRGGRRGLSTGPSLPVALSPTPLPMTLRRHLIPRSSSSVPSSPPPSDDHSPTDDVPRGIGGDDPLVDEEDEAFQNLVLEGEILSNELDMIPAGKLAASHVGRILDSVTSLHRLATAAADAESPRERRRVGSAARKRARRVAALAEGLLFRLMDEDEGGGRKGAARPSTEAYYAVIDLWRLCRSPESGRRAQNVLDRVGELYAGHMEMQPDTSTFNAVIEAWALPASPSRHSHPSPSREGEGGAVEEEEKEEEEEEPTTPQSSSQSPASSALDVLNLMEELHAAGNIYVRPDGGGYSAVLLAFAREARELSAATPRGAAAGGGRAAAAAASEAEGMLRRMIELHRSGGGAGASERARGERRDLLPTPTCFRAVVSAWVNCGSPGRALDVVDLMDGLGPDAVEGVGGDAAPEWKLDMACLSSIVNALAHAGEAERAEEVLGRMEDSGSPGHGRSVYVPPDSGVYNSVLHAWSRYRGDAGVAARRGEALLEKIEGLAAGEKGGGRHAGDGGDEDVAGVGPTTFAYMTVVRLLAKCGDRGALERIVNTLDRMERFAAQSTPGGDAEVAVNAITYTAVIDVLAKCGLPGSAEMAESVLTRMMDRYEAGDSALRPNASTFTAVIHAWTRSRESEAAEHAEELLNRMMGFYQRSGCASARPDTIAFSAVIDAWSKARRRGTAERAQSILDRMEELHRSGFDGVKPNARTFTSVMNAWAKSGEEVGVKRAEALLERMYSLYKAGDNNMMPDTIAFTSLISAMSKSRDPGSARKALDLLERMEDRGQRVGQERMKPNAITYKVALQALSRSDDGDALERAAHLLERMERMYEAEVSEVRPDTKCYNILINAYAKSKSRGKAERAWDVLVHMKEQFEQDGNLDAMPDIFSYTSVLNACAFSFHEEDRSTALGIAARAMEELQQRVSAEGPNSVTYCTLLKVYYHLMSDSAGKSELIENAFKRCCKDGQVNAAVLSNLQRVAPELWMRLLPKDVHVENVDIGDLPADWSRNVKETSRSVRKNKRR